jgi:hypothetical protein
MLARTLWSIICCAVASSSFPASQLCLVHTEVDRAAGAVVERKPAVYFAKQSFMLLRQTSLNSCVRSSS